MQQILLGFLVFRRAVQLQPVRQSHGHKPRFPVATMEHCGSAVLEAFCVADGLLHCLRHVQALHPLDLNMNARQAGNVRDIPIALSASGLYVVPVFPEEPRKLQLSSATFSLL